MAKYQSKYTGEEIDSILDGSKQMMESPVTKESLGLDKVDNTPDREKQVAHANYADKDSQGNIFLDHYATKEALNTIGTSLSEDISTVESIAKGANQAVSFANYKIMVELLNGLPESELTYKIGQNIMIVTLEVPDLWVSDILSVCEPYTYTSDEDFVNELKTHGYVRVGYCVLSCLETQKVNLGEYTKKEDIGDIDALKRITYYGDANIFPSSDDLLYYDLNSDGKSYSVSPMNPNNLGSMVIPYEYNGLPVTKVCGFNGTDIAEITLPKSIVEITDYTFSDCLDLTKAVIPYGVIKIGTGAFYNCGIEEITIPDSVKRIDLTAFAICNSLRSVYIGNGIENVGADIFYSCGTLDVYFSGTEDEWKFATEYEMTNMTIHYNWTPAMKEEVSKEILDIKAEIGDRSKLYDSPNNDLVTAINNAWNNAEYARENANYASADAGTAMAVAEKALSIAKGANQALTFADYSNVIETLLNAEAEVYKAGQNIYVIDTDVPDLWVSENVDTPKVYEYTTDEAFIEDLVTNGKVTLGWYAVSMLETQKVDLTNCATREEVGEIETALDEIITIQEALILPDAEEVEF